MAGMLSKTLLDTAVRELLASLVFLYLVATFHLIRWRREVGDPETLRGCLAEGPVILTVWHSRMLMMPLFWPAGAPLCVLGSSSADGRLALAAARKFSLQSLVRLRGASARSPRALLQCLRDGCSVGLTPDGSRGPRMRAKLGAVKLAQLSGSPIVPAAYACSSSLMLSSWDRFLVPLPFGHGVFRVGTPIHVPPDASAADLEIARRRLEDQLTGLTQFADRRVGRIPVSPSGEPAPGEAARPAAGAPAR